MKEKTLLVLAIVLFSTLVLSRITDATQHETTSESFTFEYPNAAVAADNANCSIVGSDIMQYKGGNAIDAAIATCLCQGVLQQFASGLGGGGVAVVYIASENRYFTFDFREFAPGAASENMFEQFPEESSLGGKSVAVPGELAGLWKLWSMYGDASWEDVVQPAINYADSSIVSELLGMRLVEYEEYILDSPGLSSIFAPNGVILKPGDELKQPALANTLRGIQANPLDFYYGVTALDLVKDINAAGGIITSDDLVQYYQTGVIERECTEAFFQGIKIVGAPPPFSGGLCTSLAYNLIEPYNFALMGEDSSLAQHYLIESWKWAFSDRMALGDPAFVNLTEVTPKMLSKSHAGYLRQKFSNSTTYPPPHYIDLVPLEQTIVDGGTSHMSAVDKWGNAVALTSTVNLGFGSKVLSESTGIILNNQMDDFSSPFQTNAFGLPPSVANYIAPYKKPLSSMTPTITFVNEELSMVIGGSGGTTIITAVMQSLLGVYSFGRSIGDAIAAPRCHNQNTGETKVEADYNSEFISFLESTDHHIVYSDSPIACVQGIIKNSNGGLSAASDWRKLGKPAGF